MCTSPAEKVSYLLRWKDYRIFIIRWHLKNFVNHIFVAWVLMQFCHDVWSWWGIEEVTKLEDFAFPPTSLVKMQNGSHSNNVPYNKSKSESRCRNMGEAGPPPESQSRMHCSGLSYTWISHFIHEMSQIWLPHHHLPAPQSELTTGKSPKFVKQILGPLSNVLVIWHNCARWWWYRRRQFIFNKEKALMIEEGHIFHGHADRACKKAWVHCK